MQNIFSVTYIVIAQILIYIGVTFLSGQFLPTTMESFYQSVPRWIQILGFAIVIAIPANLLMSIAYRVSGASFASIVYVIAVVTGAIIVSMLVDNIKPNWSLFISYLCLLASAVWVQSNLLK